jgi:hypothetical protein
MKGHISTFAGRLHCQHCGAEISSAIWPVNGDGVPFYYEDKSSKFYVALDCNSCGGVSYVVWDRNPGPIESLDISTNANESPGLSFDHNLYLAVKVMVEQAINCGITNYDDMMLEAERAYGARSDFEELKPLFVKAWVELCT